MTRLNTTRVLQDQDEVYAHVAATETAHGLDLHSINETALGECDQAFWGRLSLSGWHALTEMYALRHPQAFRRIVSRWTELGGWGQL
jgi:hypothetical protein